MNTSLPIEPYAVRRARKNARGIQGLLLLTIILTVVMGAIRCDRDTHEVEIGPEPAAAQERVSPQLALARICASEIGLTGSAEECAAIAAVLQRRSELRGWTFITAAQLYSSRVFDRERQDGRAWIAFLDPRGRTPERWPTEVVVRGERQPHAPWGAFRERWLALYVNAGRVLAGEIPSACGDATSDHWGMRTGLDLERATRAGWTLLDCRLPDGSLTRNAFWSVSPPAEG